VSDKERKGELDSLFKDICAVLVEKCVNPVTKRPYTMGVIERSLKDIHFSGECAHLTFFFLLSELFSGIVIRPDKK
jgi:ribosome maturation protein Sdo1